jgi:hypothetical protein
MGISTMYVGRMYVSKVAPGEISCFIRRCSDTIPHLRHKFKALSFDYWKCV